MLESELARYFAKAVAAAGGFETKITGSRRGWPDRLVCFPQCDTCFVELKQEKGRITKTQAIMHAQLIALGKRVFVMRSVGEIDRFIEGVKQL